jgi:hypothetical protein
VMCGSRRFVPSSAKDQQPNAVAWRYLFYLVSLMERVAQRRHREPH